MAHGETKPAQRLQLNKQNAAFSISSTLRLASLANVATVWSTGADRCLHKKTHTHTRTNNNNPPSLPTTDRQPPSITHRYPAPMTAPQSSPFFALPKASPRR